jgi:hypothetical protein
MTTEIRVAINICEIKLGDFIVFPDSFSSPNFPAFKKITQVMTSSGNGLILSFSHVFVASFSKSESSELKSFMQSIQSYFIPAVHPKMNSGKEFPSVPPCGCAPSARFPCGIRITNCGMGSAMSRLPCPASRRMK